MTLVVKNTFIHWGAGSEHPIYVLADSPTEAIPGQKSLRLVSDAAFPEGTISRAYSEEHGILVGRDNLREKPDTEIDSYGGWFLHEDADGAWAQGPYGGHLTAKRVEQLYDLIDEWED
ncbi:MAG: hypothetical protein RI988_2989 [Pseudomonadota bacterium]|jgi:hypothetical protein